MERIGNNDKPDSAQDVALCHNCFAQNDPKAHFCHKCNTPLSVLASMDPIARIWSMGDTWRKAASRPYKPIVLVGMWLCFGPRLALVLCYVFPVLISGPPEDVISLEGFMALGTVLAFTTLYGAILFKTTRNYLHQKQQQAAESSDWDNGEPD